MTILLVAYPFAPVSLDTAGGCEQIVALLDRELTRAGHQSIVLAREGSDVEGTLISVPATTGPIDDSKRAHAHQVHRERIERVLGEFPVDVIHMHGLDFGSYVPTTHIPLLVTLHLPLTFYAHDDFLSVTNNTRFNCVSVTQAKSFDKSSGNFIDPIANGIALELFYPGDSTGKSDGLSREVEYCLMLSRVCPEKGIHLGIEAARSAGVGVIIAGEVFDYPAHRLYFDKEIVPRLGSDARFVGPVNRGDKARLLRGARCVLLPSLAAETSSLVAMEAAACGIPVVAFHSGALPEIVENGRSGFLVDDIRAMTDCILRSDEISAEDCIEIARRRFDARRMFESYECCYKQMSNVITL